MHLISGYPYDKIIYNLMGIAVDMCVQTRLHMPIFQHYVNRTMILFPSVSLIAGKGVQP